LSNLVIVRLKNTIRHSTIIQTLSKHGFWSAIYSGWHFFKKFIFFNGPCHFRWFAELVFRGFVCYPWPIWKLSFVFEYNFLIFVWTKVIVITVFTLHQIYRGNINNLLTINYSFNLVIFSERKSEYTKALFTRDIFAHNIAILR